MVDFSYQLYSSRNFSPLEATLTMLAEAGYAAVEGYGGLYPDAAAARALRVTLDEAGLRMPTGHFAFDLVRDDPGRVVAIAETLGMEAVFVPAVPKAERVKDAAGWAAFGRALAEAGKPVRGAGLVFGWHNHDFEFANVGGAEKPLELILAGSDDLGLEFDLAWAHVAGEDPAAWVRRYAGRIVAAHLKDVAPEGEAAAEDGWADLGHGRMDWPALMAALRETGCRHFVMEHDNPSDHARFARRSLATARGL